MAREREPEKVESNQTRVELNVVDDACVSRLMGVDAVLAMPDGTTLEPLGAHHNVLIDGDRALLLAWFNGLGLDGRSLATRPAVLTAGRWRGVCHVTLPTLTAADFSTAPWRPSFPGAEHNSLQITLSPTRKKKLRAVDSTVNRMVWVIDGESWNGVVKLKALQAYIDSEYTAFSGPPAILTALADGPTLKIVE